MVPDGSPWPFPSPPATDVAAPPPVVTVAPTDNLSDRELIEQALVRIEAALNSRLEFRRQQLEEWRRAAVDLGTIAAEMIVQRKLEAGEFPLDEIIGEMIAQCSPASEIHIHLNPIDASLMRDKLFGRPPLSERPGSVQVTEDETLARGDCRVDDGHQVFLSQLNRRLREMRDELNRSLGHVPV